jgi:hypothetical protein
LIILIILGSFSLHMAQNCQRNVRLPLITDPMEDRGGTPRPQIIPGA